MADKEATVYIVDVSRSMSKSHQGREQSDLDWSLQYVWDKITATVSTGRKTLLLGVVGLGTDKTANEMMAEDPYKHISVITPIQQILMPELQRLPRVLKPSNTDDRDALSAIIIAVDLITKYCKRLKYKKKIVLITNGTGIIDADDVESTAQQMKVNAIDLVILGIDFDDAELGFKEDNKSANKKCNEETLKSLAEACNGVLGSMQEAIDELSRPQVKLTKPVPTYRGQLRLGDPTKYDTALIVDVERYAKVMIRRPPTASAFAFKTGPSQAESGLDPIRNEFNYHVIDKSVTGNKRDIQREDLAKGYEYGRTAVHISESDENITKLETEAGYEIMGFIPVENVERYMIIENSNMLVAQKGDVKAALAMSSLVQALYIQDSVAVARLVKKDMAEPALMLLSPLVEADFECLIENVLPFAEDVRTYRFPPLDKVLTVSGKTLTSHRNLPSKDLLDSMSDFVDSMNLIDEDEDLMAMDDTFSPVLHTVEGAIRHRAIHPDAPVPPKAEAYLAYSKQPDELKVQSREALDCLVEAADVKKVPPKVKGRRKYREADKPISGLDVEDLFRKEKRGTKINPQNAIPEFKQALDTPDDMNVVKDVVRQMFKIIEGWISSSFGDMNYDRAVEGLRVVRKEMNLMEEWEMYNNPLKGLKEKVWKGELNGNRKDFWMKLRFADKGELGLLSSEDVKFSTVSRDEAERFWTET